MRFVLREGSGFVARADVTMLTAIGLPGGGVVRLGATHVRVVSSDVPAPNVMLVPPDAFANGAGAPGAAVDATRAVVPAASTVSITVDGAPIDSIPRELLTVPVGSGDRFVIDGATFVIAQVDPGPFATIASGTIATTDGGTWSADPSPATDARPTTESTIIAGLDNELELLTGWLGLLTDRASDDVNGPVAGVVIAGPPGSGRSELVDAAAAALGLEVVTIDVRTVTTPERLLAMLERSLRSARPRSVLVIDHLDPLIGRDSTQRHQMAAVMRWFLDAVASADGVATVLVTAHTTIGDELDARDLLRRTLEVAPPNHIRRRALLEAGLGDATNIDLDVLVNATPGFSALDISTAILDARARARGRITTDRALEAIHATPASLGTTTLGSIPSYGFDRVANLDDVKQALTETVIWQLTDPGRFERMGIEPARGVLLYGPPGTGKTYVIRALAHEAGAAFFSIKGAELLDKWVGESERGVREVFARARTVAPSIIFFDELDALAPVRGSSTNTVTDSVVAALLTELDGVSRRGDVFVIGATNRMDLIDPALLRPGRLEVHLLLDLPGPEARAAFFDMTSVPLAEDVDRTELVRVTAGSSFADLDGILRRAAIAAMRTNAHADLVTMKDLSEALASPEVGPTGD